MPFFFFFGEHSLIDAFTFKTVPRKLQLEQKKC